MKLSLFSSNEISQSFLIKHTSVKMNIVRKLSICSCGETEITDGDSLCLYVCVYVSVHVCVCACVCVCVCVCVLGGGGQ